MKMDDNTYKIFIACPMHGLSEEEIVKNRLKILERVVKQYSEEIGDKEVILLENLWHKNVPAGSHRIIYLAESIKLLPQADLIYFAKGWETAKGCSIEAKVCEQYGLKAVYEF